MKYKSERGKPKNPFTNDNTMGLPGHVFGRHWHQKTGPKVNPSGHGDFSYDVRIRWVPEYEDGSRYLFGHRKGEPAILAHDKFWAMFNSDMDVVEHGSGFPIREHCRKLVARSSSKMPVILEWGCGEGNAVNDLTTDPQIRGKALVFGYSDIWDVKWNKINGVKFLFFVKEHLPEYFKRSGQGIDFIYTHCGLEKLHGQELMVHLKALAPLMPVGALIVFSDAMCRRTELLEVNDLFQLSPDQLQAGGSDTSIFLMRK